MRRRGWAIRQNRAVAAIALALSLCLVAVVAAPAAAQQQYELEGGQWHKTASPAPGTPQAELQTIRKVLAEGHAGRAQSLADDWLDHHQDDPLRAEAYLVRGDAKAAQRHYYDALFDYEQVIRGYPASPQFQTALEREYRIALLFTGGLNRRFLGLRILPADDIGEELLIRIQERAPGSDLGQRASLSLADYYFDQSKWELAAQAYGLFLENYPRSRRREWVMLRLIQTNLARYRGPRFDPTGLIEAMQRLKTYRDEFPASAQRIGADAMLLRIKASLAQVDEVTAKWYERRNQPISAAYMYKRILAAYPESPAAHEALQRLQALRVPVAKLPGDTK